MAGQRTYNIGQIIYIMSDKNQSVVPAIVAEEDSRKIRKQDGIHEVVSYKLCIGPKERPKFVELSRINGEVFESLDAVRETLVGRLTSFVDELVKNTQLNVSNWYGITADNQVLDQTDDVSKSSKIDPEQLIHAVNNNVPIHNALNQHPLQLQNNGMVPSNNLRDNIRAMVQDDEELPGMGQQTPQLVKMPDGTLVPIKF
jgi:hypothetical protein